MIPATHPYEARFRQTTKLSSGGTHEYFTNKPVLAWDNEGAPLVAGKQGLVAADTYTNFHDVVPAKKPVVAVLPGVGWVAEYKDGDDTVSWPVVCWTIDAAGEMTPLAADISGYCDDATSSADFIRLYRPDEEPSS